MPKSTLFNFEEKFELVLVPGRSQLNSSWPGHSTEKLCSTLTLLASFLGRFFIFFWAAPAHLQASQRSLSALTVSYTVRTSGHGGFECHVIHAALLGLEPT